MANKEKFKVEQVEAALRASAGLHYLAADKLRCSPSTITNYVERYKSLQKAVVESRETTKDIAEAELIKKIKRGDTVSIIFFLKTQGKERGYTERQELTGPNGEKLGFVIEAPPVILNFEEWAATYKPKAAPA